MMGEALPMRKITLQKYNVARKLATRNGAIIHANFVGPTLVVVYAHCFRALYSNSAEIFKRPKNREDSSDLDENLSESIAATQTFI